MKNWVFVLALLVTKGVMAQADSGKVAVLKDPRMEVLIKKQIQINEETTRDSRRSIPGYRIQVINSNNRDKVFSLKSKIYQQYPELKLYLMYQPPNYRLKAGNFRTPEDADVYLKKLSSLFPSGMYVIHDTIEVKQDKSREDENN
jgi:hypothetical protein